MQGARLLLEEAVVMAGTSVLAGCTGAFERRALASCWVEMGMGLDAEWRLFSLMKHGRSLGWVGFFSGMAGVLESRNDDGEACNLRSPKGAGQISHPLSMAHQEEGLLIHCGTVDAGLVKLTPSPGCV